MRRFYGQRRALTLAKLAIVGLAYVSFLAATLAGTLLLSALVT
jgi:hypothetical protein